METNEKKPAICRTCGSCYLPEFNNHILTHTQEQFGMSNAWDTDVENLQNPSEFHPKKNTNQCINCRKSYRRELDVKPRVISMSEQYETNAKEIFETAEKRAGLKNNTKNRSAKGLFRPDSSKLTQYEEGAEQTTELFETAIESSVLKYYSSTNIERESFRNENCDKNNSRVCTEENDDSNSMSDHLKQEVSTQKIGEVMIKSEINSFEETSVSPGMSIQDESSNSQTGASYASTLGYDFEAEEKMTVPHKVRNRKRKTVPTKYEKKRPQVICKTCGKGFTCRSQLERHSYVHGKMKRKVNYTCGTCGKGFRFPSDIKVHLYAHGDMKPPVSETDKHKCEICGKRFEWLLELMKHGAVHGRLHKDKPLLECETCGKSFRWPYRLKMHMNVHKNEKPPVFDEDKPYKCQICGKGFNFKSVLKRHGSVHGGPKRIHPKKECPVCRKFVANLRPHMKTHPGVELPEPKPEEHKCDTCGREFKRVCDLKRHIRIHTYGPRKKNRPLLHCEKCGKTFKWPYRLRQHMKVHKNEKPVCEKERPHQCQLCGKRFRFLSNLKRHAFIHGGEKPKRHRKECPACGKFVINLPEHMKLHPELELPELTPEEISSHKCNICGKGFKGGLDLKRHLVTHAVVGQVHKKEKNISEEERPHQCQFCGSRFRFLSNLKRHALIHGGEKPTICHRKECPTCGKFVMNLQEHMKKHPEVDLTELAPVENFEKSDSHICNICERGFKSEPDLKRHLVTHAVVGQVLMSEKPVSEKKRPNQCQLCGKHFRFLSSLKRHAFIHGGEKPTICHRKECPTCGKFVMNLQEHMKKHPEVDPPETAPEENFSHVCNICERRFKSEPDLKRHLVTHAVIGQVHKNETPPIVEKHKPHRCELCGRGFRFRSELKRHGSVHGGPKRINPKKECRICGKVVANMQTHMNTHPGVEVPEPRPEELKCDICGREFKTIPILRRHLVTHAREKIKRFAKKCEFCGKSFQWPYQLRMHMVVHKKEKPHLCDICGKGFSFRISMIEHRKIHSGKKENECEHCGSSFYRKVDMKRHVIALHTDHKPYPCPDCDKKFAFTSLLRKHSIVHLKEKTHVCHICGKGFRRTNCLRRHMDTHTGIRPHKCLICGKGFFTKMGLKRHIINVHHEEDYGKFMHHDTSQTSEISQIIDGVSRFSSDMNAPTSAQPIMDASEKDSEDTRVPLPKSSEQNDGYSSTSYFSNSISSDQNVYPNILSRPEEQDGLAPGIDSSLLYSNRVPLDQNAYSISISQFEEQNFGSRMRECNNEFNSSSSYSHNVPSDLTVRSKSYPDGQESCAPKLTQSNVEFNSSSSFSNPGPSGQLVRSKPYREDQESCTPRISDPNSSSSISNPVPSNRPLHSKSHPGEKETRAPEVTVPKLELNSCSSISNQNPLDWTVHSKSRPKKELDGSLTNNHVNTHRERKTIGTIKVEYDSYTQYPVVKQERLSHPNPTSENDEESLDAISEYDDFAPADSDDNTLSPGPEEDVKFTPNLNDLKFSQSEKDSVQNGVLDDDNLTGDDNQAILDWVKIRPKLSCETCGESFKWPYQLNKHLNVHKNKKSPVVSAAPVSVETEKDRPYKCEICGKGFKAIGVLKQHASVHGGPKRKKRTKKKCHVCGKFVAVMKAHMKMHPGVEVPEPKPEELICDICGREFKGLSNLKIHYAIHTREKPKRIKLPKKCEVCGKHFHHLKRHMEIHSETEPAKPYLCDICGREFRFKVSMVEHRKIHSGDKQHKCEQCESAFYRKVDLKQHVIAQHTDYKPYPCPDCDKKFAFKFLVKKHSLVHLKENPHVCHICGKGFKRSNCLKKHMDVHNDIRPHKCLICGKAFHTKMGLKRHVVNVHHEEDFSKFMYHDTTAKELSDVSPC